MYDAVRAWGGLDVNSPYAYLLACDRYGAQSCIAERHGQLLGFVVGLVSPQSPFTLFVWQVGVAPAARGQGLAGRLIDAILQRDPKRYGWVEAHVGHRNHSSMRLFEGLAHRHHTSLMVREAYPASWFPSGHDAEQLVRVGPLSAVPEPQE